MNTISTKNSCTDVIDLRREVMADDLEFKIRKACMDTEKPRKLKFQDKDSPKSLLKLLKNELRKEEIKKNSQKEMKSVKKSRVGSSHVDKQVIKLIGKKASGINKKKAEIHNLSEEGLSTGEIVRQARSSYQFVKRVLFEDKIHGKPLSSSIGERRLKKAVEIENLLTRLLSKNPFVTVREVQRNASKELKLCQKDVSREFKKRGLF